MATEKLFGRVAQRLFWGLGDGKGFERAGGGAGGVGKRNLKNTDIGILARLTSRVDPTRPTTRSLEL